MNDGLTKGEARGWAEMGLLPSLVAALAVEKISVPMPIQVESMPVLLAGKDAYLNSETGTGKTLAYLLPLFQKIDPLLAATQMVVVVPTHELAIQIQRQAGALAVNSGLPIRSVLLIGGTLMQRQIDKLKKKPQVVIGSAGRIRELIFMGKVKTDQVRSVVLDEADRLLSAESLASVRVIVKSMPPQRQLVFVSATEQDGATREATVLAPGLVMVRAGSGRVNSDIEHLYMVCEERDKPDWLRKLIRAMNPERSLVFVHRNEDAEVMASKLAHHKIKVADLHGAFTKVERKKAMDDFRGGHVNVLMASDVAARGLDIKGVTHIFNFDVPSESLVYLHRVGRTARAGAKGRAITLLSERELRLVRRFESELGITMTPILLREGEVVVEA
ncbi:MAG: DEAD/DEAH box helicase [bacterium]